MKPATLLLVMATAALSHGECRAAWLLDAEAGFVFDDNVSHAQLDKDIKSDISMEASATAGHRFQLTDSSSASVTADFRDARYARYSGLDHTDLGLTVAARTKFGMGSFAPWLRSSLSASHMDYRSDIRDGWLYAAGLGAGKRISERVELSAEYRYEKRIADNPGAMARGRSTDVFSQQNHTTSVRIDFVPSTPTMLSLGYSRRSGDITSTTLRNNAIFRISSAIATDTVFGADGVAYKMGATTHALSIGASHEVSSHASVNFSIERAASYGEGNINYYGNVIRGTFLYNF